MNTRIVALATLLALSLAVPDPAEATETDESPVRPTLDVEDGFVVIDRRSPHTVVMRTTGVKDLRVRVGPYAADDIPTARTNNRWAMGLTRRPDAIASADDGDGSRIVEPEIHGAWQRISFDDLVAPGEAGAAFFEISGTGLRTRWGMVLFTGIGLTVRNDDRRCLLMVTDLATAEPLPGARVEIRDTQGERLWSGRADSDGVVEAPGWRELGGTRGNLWVVAVWGSDKALLPLPSMNMKREQTLLGRLVPDRGLYLPGETVYFKGYARIDQPDGVILASDVLSHLRVTLHDHDGALVSGGFSYWPGQEDETSRFVSLYAAMVLQNPQPVVFSSEGQAPLYYRVEMTYTSSDPDPPARDAGFEISRCYLSDDPDEVFPVGGQPESAHDPCDIRDDQRIPPGSEVWVVLTVATSEPRQYVAIDDPLPAGLEAVDRPDPPFSNYHYWSPANRPGEFLVSKLKYDHREMHADRVLFFCDDLPAGTYTVVYKARATNPGEFTAGPATVHEMYRPEISGRTTRARIQVLDH